MATLADLIERVRVAARDRPQRDRLKVALDNIEELVELDSGDKIAESAYITIDFEEIHVRGSAVQGQLNTTRGVNGTAAVAHSINSIVFHAYRHSRDMYRRAINSALDAINIGFGKPAWDTTQGFPSGAGLITVPANALRVFELGFGDELEPVPFAFVPSVPTSLITTGKALRLISWNPGRDTAYIGYEVPWPNLTQDTDVLDAAFPADGVDLIDKGAVAYLSDPEQFARIAYHEPHLRLFEQAVAEGSVRAHARDALARFFLRRQELSVRRPKKMHWVKG